MLSKRPIDLSLVIFSLLYLVGVGCVLSKSNASKKVTKLITGVVEPKGVNQAVVQNNTNGSSYPFAVGIGVGNFVKKAHVYENIICTGSIIDKLRVITSCSCFHGRDFPPQIIRHPEEYFVAAGFHSEVGQVDILRVDHMLFHPMCDMREEYETWYANVAVLFLVKPGFNFSITVQPMKFPIFEVARNSSKELRRMADSSTECLVVGWSPDSPKMLIQQAELIPLENCINPSCDPLLICPQRNDVNGFMIRIPPNTTRITTGAPLVCNKTVWSITDTHKRCSGNEFTISSTYELLLGVENFKSIMSESPAGYPTKRLESRKFLSSQSSSIAFPSRMLIAIYVIILHR